MKVLRGARQKLLDAPVDLASLASFRILFGLVMAFAMLRFLGKGWVNQLYVEPRFHFGYPGFEWVHPWPAAWMHAHFVVLAVLAIGVAVGACYRFCIVSFFLGFAYVELMDQTAYLNHYYLVSLLSGILCCLPAHRMWSVDAWRKPEWARESAPAWTINLLRFQIAVVYFFAGLAKVNGDWLFHAQPLRIWLAANSGLPVIGSWLAQPWVAFAASWFGAIYDLSIPFLLLHRRTRAPAFVAVVVFHVATLVLFNIGMFPWIMIAATTVFFRPDWPRSFLSRFGWQSQRRENRLVWPAAGLRSPRWLLAILAVYAAIQVALPLRPYLLDREHPAWSCRGFNLAWQVMVAEKTGYAEFYARDDATGKLSRLNPAGYLTPRQEAMMGQDPYLIRIMAEKFAADIRAREGREVEVFVNAYATINGHPSQRIIDPEINLAGPVIRPWILPLADSSAPLRQSWTLANNNEE